ncbi:MAG TPA: hypothetical protein VGR00_09205, partial [Thermoanaerobaculia bacterium]|nr:hypothetical protein [Thermoanaerobaculia bacterium]
MRRPSLLSLLAALALAAPLAAQTPFGTAFTFQGRLSDVGAPADGLYDIRFRLYDAYTIGNLKGTVTKNGVLVSGGRFTVDLDFGGAAFDGNARWLELLVQKMGGGFTMILPRQELTGTPYATTIFARTVVVKPLGTAAQNGSQLVAAVNGITTASVSNRWTVKLEPGVYDVGNPGTLLMKPFVDLEGSGENVTRITGTGSGGNSLGTLAGASNAEVRFVTVEN